MEEAPLRKYKRSQWFLLISKQLRAGPHRLPRLPQDHGGRLGVALLRSMEVAGESRGVARGPFEHPGSPKESPKKPSGALGGVRDVLRCFAIDLKNIEKRSFLQCFRHHEVALGLAWVRFVGERAPQRIHAFLRRLQRPLRGPHIIPSVPITSLEMPRECLGAPRDLQGAQSRHGGAPKPRPPYGNTRKTNGFY